MSKIPIIIDCDTGVDDAVAILLAHQISEFELVALTSVAGNVELDKTTRNALSVVELIGADTPVYQGADGPMFIEQVTAAEIHGKNGLGGMVLPCTRSVVEGINAWDAIYQEAVKRNGELQIVAVGPLTNLGLAFVKYSQLPKLIKRIVIMGGSATIGNQTPAAEFNIYADPEAADIVFASGVPVYMCGLDVTMKAYLLPEEVEAIGALGSKPARFFRDVVQPVQDFSVRTGLEGMCYHDPVALLYAMDDSFFETHPAYVRVETKGLITKGRTVTDLYSDKKLDKNAYVVTNLDREKFKDWIFNLMSKY